MRTRLVKYQSVLSLLFLLVVFAEPVFAEERIVKVGAFHFAPAIFPKESGQVDGMFVDLLNEIGRQENIRFEYVPGSWAEGLERLRSGDVDLLTSVAYTDERAAYMDYTETPLLTVWAEVYVNEAVDMKSENIIHWLNGKDIAVMEDDFNAASFRSLIEKFNISCQYQELPGFRAVLEAVSSGEADAGVVSVLAASTDAREYDVKPTGLVFNPFDIYLTVAKGKNTDLLEVLDGYLSRWRQQDDSPYYTAHEKWFHSRVQKVEVAPEWVSYAGWLVVAGAIIFLLFIYLLRQQVKSATEKLYASESHFRNAISEAPIPIMLYSEDGEILSLSRAWTTISGYQDAELTHIEDWVKRAFPKEEDLFIAEIMRVFHEQEQSFCGDAVISCRDGTERIWSFHFRVIGCFPAGNKIAVCMASDETERLRREQELQKSEERFRLLFEQMISGFALHEIVRDDAGHPVDYRFLLVNKAFENLTGLLAEDIVGKTVKDVMPDIEPLWIEQYAKVARTKEPCEFDAYSTLFDKHFMVRAYAPRTGQFATVFTDITEKRRIDSERKDFIEQLEAKNAELERIAYTISHDLKAPLVTVSGFAGQLQANLESGDLQTALVDIGFIRGAAEKMKSLITELLEYTRLGHVVEKRVQIRLSDILNEVLKPFEGDFVALNFQVVRPQADVQLFAVPRRMVELWQNLVDNAIKYRAVGGPRHLEIGFDGSGPETEFYVRDNGIGIEPAYRGKIFNIFEKLDPDVEGTGIGLAIVKRIVTVNEGNIWLEEQDQWTCFRFTLPLALRDGQTEETNE